MGWGRVRSWMKKLEADYAEPFKLRFLLMVKMEALGGF